jgi:hypothetical protein
VEGCPMTLSVSADRTGTIERAAADGDLAIMR